MGMHHKCTWNCGGTGCNAPDRPRLVVDNTPKGFSKSIFDEPIKINTRVRYAPCLPMKYMSSELMDNVMYRILNDDSIPDEPEDGYYWDEANARIREIEGHPRWDKPIRYALFGNKPQWSLAAKIGYWVGYFGIAAGIIAIAAIIIGG